MTYYQDRVREVLRSHLPMRATDRFLDVLADEVCKIFDGAAPGREIYLKDCPHTIDNCPTWYDGCNCSSEALEDNIKKRNTGEKLLKRAEPLLRADKQCACSGCQQLIALKKEITEFLVKG